ncbi:uncharacterized protein LY89DRAFT_41738 [Mollisia scopiformis]|uniref:2EXR domain-containing protein n=1 Tax=Mollisia scopiformis TaxID=149040 RepID=A0A194XEM5_MOLSC|nr:uncharacterized protein LY89DRAFT_41738 [Mollisia scopiformis]KUJ18207.1 hypothetical protein LY89DRAFT_41738 [Mollisia scopiformis]
MSTENHSPLSKQKMAFTKKPAVAVAAKTELPKAQSTDVKQNKADKLSAPAVEAQQEEVTHDTFTCFPNLPVELRYKWELAANAPRLVPLVEVIVAQSEEESDYYCDEFEVNQKSGNPQPAVLQVCQESRAECMQYFELVFGSQHYRGSFWSTELVKQKPAVYFNASCDIFHMSSRFCSNLNIFSGWGPSSDPTLARICSLKGFALNVEDFDADKWPLDYVPSKRSFSFYPSKVEELQPQVN